MSCWWRRSPRAFALGSGLVGEEHNYRQDVSVWFRSIWILQPRGDLMAQAPLYFQVHVLTGLALFVLWPFTRLVHAFSAPFGYLFRPYIVYRSREVAVENELVGSHPRRRGWLQSDSAHGQNVEFAGVDASQTVVQRFGNPAGLDLGTFSDRPPVHLIEGVRIRIEKMTGRRFREPGLPQYRSAAGCGGRRTE